MMKRLTLAATVSLVIAAAVPAPAQDQGATCPPEDGDIRILAEGNAWSNHCLGHTADDPFKLELVNNDPFSHNLSIYREKGGESLFMGKYVTGESSGTYDVPALPEGRFYFRCDIHPTMEGTFLSGDVAAASPTGGASGTPTEQGSVSPATGAPLGPTVRLERVATGITAPVFITSPKDGSGRLFIVDQVGLIHVVGQDGRLREQPFLDVKDKLVELNEAYDERGLLGLAFAPDYRDSRRFFVYYSAPLREGAPEGWNHTSHVARFTASATDPDRADPQSETVVLRVDQPQVNHNGGHIAFGPDGMLYIPLGDGGGGNDVGVGHNKEIGNGQDLTTMLGKVLRIDVSGDAHTVPQDNPFVSEPANAAKEIWALGFRNPYHLSFDSGGDRSLMVADAGQDRFEEMSIVTKGGNFGWRVKEGTHCFSPETPSSPPETCPDKGARGEDLIDPVVEYSREEILGSVIVGGYVYRGDAMDQLEGAYVFGDYSRDRIKPDGTIFAATPKDEGLWDLRELPVEVEGDTDNDRRLGRFVLSFGEDEAKNLYVGVIERGGPAGMTGAVYRFASASGDDVGGDPTGATGDGGGAGTWVFIAILALILLIVAGLVLGRKRRTE